MADAYSHASNKNTQWIYAPQEVLYRAFTDPTALADWLAPDDMTGKVHHFDLRVGEGYQMSLYYPVWDQLCRAKLQTGKTPILPGLWNLRRRAELSQRLPLIPAIRLSQGK